MDTLIARIYDAGLFGDPPWSAMVAAVVQAFGARTGWLIHSASPAASPEILGSIGASAEAVAMYSNRYWQRDPWFAGIAARPGAVYASHLHIDAAAFAATEIYADYVVPDFDDTTWALAAAIPLPEGSSAILSLHRTRAAGPFSGGEPHGFGRLLPHLRNALLLRHRLGRVAEAGAAAAEALSALGSAVILLDRANRVIFASAPAQAILNASKALRIAPEGLRAAAPAVRDRLQRSLARARHPAAPEGGMVRIDAVPGGSPLAMLVAPFGRDGRVICVLGDPMRNVPIAEAHLRTLFGLTRAEARLACAIGAGLRLEAVAATHGVSMNTVRTQLRAVLAKTGCDRQTDLLRLLARLPALAG